MRKILLSFIALLACFGIGFAQDKTVTFDFLNNDYGYERGSTAYLTNDSIQVSPVQIKLLSGSGNGFRMWSDGLRCYKGSEFVLSVSEGYEITQVTMSGAAAFKDAENVVLNNSTSWAGVPAQELTFSLTSTSAKALTKLTVTYQEATGGEVQYLVSYSGDHGSLFYSTESATDTQINGSAKFSEGEVISLKAQVDEGYKFISITDNGNDVKESLLAGDYIINGIAENHAIEAILDEVMPENTVKFNFEINTYGYTRESGNSKNYLESGSTCVEEPVTITLTKNEGATGMRFWSDGLRFMKDTGAALTVSVPEGYVVKKIKLNGSQAFALSVPEDATDEEIATYGTYADGEWTGSCQSVTLNFTAKSTGTMKNIVVEYATAEATPSTYKVTYEGANGSLMAYELVGVAPVTEEGIEYEPGDYPGLFVRAYEGYKLQSMTDNGVDVTEAFADEATYTIANIDCDHHFVGVFVEDVVVPEKPAAGSILVPASDFGSGKQNYQFRFDDAPLGDHVNGTNTATTDLRSRNLTYSAWVNLKNVSDGQVVMGNIQTAFADATGAFLVTYKNGKLNLNGRNATDLVNFENKEGSATTDAGTPNDEWVFISVVADQDAGTVTLYKNCEPISSFNTTYGLGILQDEACFFVSDKGASIAIDEVQLWNKALSANELKDSYNLKSVDLPEALVAYFKATELVEGSTTDLRNLGSEGTTTASLYLGNYNLIGGWNPQFSGLAKQELTLNDESKVLKTVNVTVEQPESEGNSIKLVREDGTEVEGTATLFEKLSVEGEFNEGIKILSINVHEINNNVDSVYTVDQLPFYINDDSKVSVRLNDLYTVKANIENGTATISINDGGELPLPEAGTQVAHGSKVVVFFKPVTNSYKLTAFEVNGEDYLENMKQNVYAISNIDNDYTFDVTFSTPRYHLTVINPTDVAELSYYGEFRNNNNERLEYDDAEGLWVNEGERVYFYVNDPATPGAKLLDVTDNGVSIMNDLMPFGAGQIFIMGAIYSDHEMEVTQENYAAIGGIAADGNGIVVSGNVISVSEDAVIELIDLNGRVIMRGEGTQLDIASLVNGVYVVRATTAGGVLTAKIVK